MQLRKNTKLKQTQITFDTQIEIAVILKTNFWSIDTIIRLLAWKATFQLCNTNLVCYTQGCELWGHSSSWNAHCKLHIRMLTPGLQMDYQCHLHQTLCPLHFPHLCKVLPQKLQQLPKKGNKSKFQCSVNRYSCKCKVCIVMKL